MEQVKFKYLVDPFSIMVINQRGYLRKLYCPFRVLSVESIEGIPMGTWCFVDRVAQDNNELIIYDINGKRLSYRHFQIYITF